MRLEDKVLDGWLPGLQKKEFHPQMNRSRCLIALFAASLLAYFVPQGLAQNPRDQAELARQSQSPGGPVVETSGVSDGQAVASPNDPDLGVQQILKRQDEYQPFTIAVGVPFYYTSNVALVSSGEVSDFIVAPTVGLFYDPRFTKTFYGHLGVREQLFYYSDNSGFNFGAFDFEAGVTYFLPQFHNLILRALYDYNRLTRKDSFDAFFENHGLLLNVELPFHIGRAQRVAIGADVNISMAGEPDNPRRHDFDAYIGYGINVTRAFSVDAVQRVVVRQYVLTDRVDVSEILAVTASYRIAKWCTASVIGSLAANQSNKDVFEYEVGNFGGAGSFNLKF
jgi:hypothetical protein